MEPSAHMQGTKRINARKLLLYSSKSGNERERVQCKHQIINNLIFNRYQLVILRMSFRVSFVTEKNDKRQAKKLKIDRDRVLMM